jgi:hypothetical protein
MLNFNWKFLTPVALATLTVVMVADKLLPADPAFGWLRLVVLLVVNLVVFAATVGIITLAGRRHWVLVQSEK